MPKKKKSWVLPQVLKPKRLNFSTKDDENYGNADKLDTRKKKCRICQGNESICQVIQQYKYTVEIYTNII